MLENLKPLPDDPLLGVTLAYRADTDPRKIDLGVGVYKTESGETPIPAAVLSAARQLAAEQSTKVYVGQAGNARFNDAMLELTLGAGHPAIRDGRVKALQAPGGCGALRLGAELVRIAAPDVVVHLSDPTWANHVPLFANAGLAIDRYPYLDRARGVVDVAAMLARLECLPRGAVVLLHGCCHNPSGADLSQSDWRAVVEILERRALIPFVDIAYQGLGTGLEADAYGARLCVERLPEVLIAVSCSKNFGLYRERTGAVLVASRSAAHVQLALSQLQRIARGIYSMPPDHGAELVARVWHEPALRAAWLAEVGNMRERITALRAALVAEVSARRAELDYGFVARQRGMFSLLPLSPAQIGRLQREHHVYMPADGRANIAGISQRNIGWLADAIAAVS